MNVDRPARGIRVPWKSRREQLPSDVESTVPRRLNVLNFLPKKVKGHLVACAGEFVGTFLFLLFALGGTNVVNTAPAVGVNATANLAANPAKLLYISLCFGMSLAVNAWVFFRISGGLFNPAVTVGMMIIGSTNYIRGPLIIIAQVLGGISASAVVSALFPGPLAVRTELGGGTSIVQGLFIEMFLTAMLVFTIFMLAAEKHEGTYIAPVGIGLALFIAELMGVYYTGGSLNPARSFGPCVVVRSFNGYHWIYWVGPLLGAILASCFYLFIKSLEYETVNKEVSPDEIVGKKFDPVTKREQLITRGGSYMNVHPGVNGEKTTSAPIRPDSQHDYARGASYNNATYAHQTATPTTNQPVFEGGVAGGTPLSTGPASGLVYDHVTDGRNRLTSPGSDTTYTNERNGNYRDPYSAAPAMEGGKTTHVP